MDLIGFGGPSLFYYIQVGYVRAIPRGSTWLLTRRSTTTKVQSQTPTQSHVRKF